MMHYSTISAFLAPFVVASFTRISEAQVTVTYHAGTSTVQQTFPTGLGVTIPIVIGNQHTYVEVWCSPASADMGLLEVSADVPGTPPNNVYILLTHDGLQFPSDISQSNFAAGSWAGIEDSRGKIRVRAGISQNLTGHIQLLDNSELVDLRANGSIQNSIQCGQLLHTGTSVWTGSITSAGDFTKTDGAIDLISVTSGNMLGDIKAVAGSIGTIDVTGGDIGASGQPVAIEAAAATSGVNIVRVNAYTDIHANIDCDTSTPAADGVIQTFFVGHTGNPIAGDFRGSLRMGGFSEQVTIVRDLYGSIVHGGVMAPGPQNSSLQQIAIGRSFKSGASVTISMMASGGEDDGSGDGDGAGGGTPEIDWDYFTDCLTNGTPAEQAACLAELQGLLQP